MPQEFSLETCGFALVLAFCLSPFISDLGMRISFQIQLAVCYEA